MLPDRWSQRFPRWLGNPAIKIVLLGTAAWLIYLSFVVDYPLAAFVAKYPLTDLGRVNQWSQGYLIRFALTIVGSFAIYLVAWRIARKHPETPRLTWIILGFAALFALTFLFMYPVGATDLFEYVFHSRILVHYDQNPLATPPRAFPGDPFLKTVNWAVQASPYGPVWTLMTVPFSALGGNDLVRNLYLFKFLTALFYWLSALMISFILRQHDPEQQAGGTLLFAWNPLVLFEWPGNGHNGGVMMFFVLLAIFFLLRRRWTWVIPALLASVLSKYVSAILLLPFLIYCLRAQGDLRSQFRYLWQTSLISLVLVAIWIAPFFAVPTGLLYEANFYSLLALPTLPYLFIRPFHGDQAARMLIQQVTSGLYLAVYSISLVVLFRPGANARRLVLLGTWLTIGYLWIACMHFQPWFVLWPIALGIWVNNSLARRVLVLFSASALLAYGANFVWIWNIATWQHLHVNLMYAIVIYTLPLAMALFELYKAIRANWSQRRTYLEPRPAFET